MIFNESLKVPCPVRFLENEKKTVYDLNLIVWDFGKTLLKKIFSGALLLQKH
jgi:hypothetical protein